MLAIIFALVLGCLVCAIGGSLFGLAMSQHPDIAALVAAAQDSTSLAFIDSLKALPE